MDDRHLESSNHSLCVARPSVALSTALAVAQVGPTCATAVMTKRLLVRAPCDALLVVAQRSGADTLGIPCEALQGPGRPLQQQGTTARNDKGVHLNLAHMDAQRHCPHCLDLDNKARGGLNRP